MSFAAPVQGTAKVTSISAEFCDGAPKVFAVLSDGNAIWIDPNNTGDRGRFKTFLPMLLTAKTTNSDLFYMADETSFTQYCTTSGYNAYLIKLL